MQKFSLRHGAIAGIGCGLLLTSAYLLGFQTKGNRVLILATLLLNYSASFGAIFFARKYNNGEIDFKNSIKIGISAALIYALIFTAFTAFYYYILNPNFADKYLVDIEISLKHLGKTGDALKKDMDEWREDMSAYNQTLKLMFSNAISSSVFAAINALILCKKD